MLHDKTWSRYGRHINKYRGVLILSAATLVVLSVCIIIFVFARINNGAASEKRELLRIWNTEDYAQVYQISKNALNVKPIDYFLLTINGFAAYQLGISQINSHNTLFYINECIFSLRKALLLKESYNDGRVFYVLGKAYCKKGNEYADLAIKYLEKASDLNYDAQDIPEFLGIAYASCGEYRSSVEAFSLAFIPEKQPSDTLLLSIARSYIAMEEFGIAIGYLHRCIDTSADSKSVVIARYLLAEIYINSGDYDSAEKQFLSILDGSGANAEVHYQLGELYLLKGDSTRARSEWRIAFRHDPTHAKVRARLNI